MSHTQCDSSASPGDSRVLTQLGLCHYSCPHACVFEHWQDLSPTDAFPLKCAETETRAVLQGEACLWGTGASKDALHRGTNPLGE